MLISLFFNFAPMSARMRLHWFVPVPFIAERDDNRP